MKYKFTEYMPTSAYVAALVALDAQRDDYEKAYLDAIHLDMMEVAMYFKKQIREVEKAKHGLEKMFKEI